MPAPGERDPLIEIADAAEVWVLAALMVIHPCAVPRVTPIIKPGDFFRERHRWIYEACLRAAALRPDPLPAGWPDTNQLSVAKQLMLAGHLDEVGGLTFLSTIIRNLMAAEPIEVYAAEVADCARRWRQALQGSAMIRDAYMNRGHSLGRGGIGL